MCREQWALTVIKLLSFLYYFCIRRVMGDAPIGLPPRAIHFWKAHVTRNSRDNMRDKPTYVSNFSLLLTLLLTL